MLTGAMQGPSSDLLGPTHLSAGITAGLGPTGEAEVA
jgi:hypothetical protein